MSGSAIRKRQQRDLIKLTVFLVLSAIFIVWLGAIMGAVRPGNYATYHAVFHDISGLQNGDQVRIAGVDVGKVTDIEVRKDATVLVSFRVRPGNPLNQSARATVQYKNLIGDRDLLLTRPDSSAPLLPPGSTISANRTRAALDLDTLLQGFRPLFEGLAPQQVNELSSELIAVLQGQSTAVSQLVSTVGSVTTTLGDREQLITSVVGNLNSVLGTIDAHRGTLGKLIDELEALVTGLNGQDTQVLDAAHRIDGFARDATGLLSNARGSITPDLRNLDTAATKLNGRAGTLQALLSQLPKHYAKMLDTASYGNFFNFFLCGVKVTVSGSDDQPLATPWIKSDAARCRR